MTPDSACGKQIHFVTGRLAEPGLRKVVEHLAETVGFKYSIDVMPISVAALLTPKWIAPRISVPTGTDFVVIPGYCDSNLSHLESTIDVPIFVGPKDYRQLPEFFGNAARIFDGFGDYSIEIIAEINHAPRLKIAEVVKQAQQLADNGADVIDIGCDPNSTWHRVGECVSAVRDQGLRVSIDSFDVAEINAAIDAGAELVLSVNATNRDAVKDWNCEVVAIPDEIATLGGLDETIDLLEKHNKPYRIDPILEPIGCGFAASLDRYIETRKRYANSKMMMGIGNLTELTEVDSAGVNFVMLGICQELNIDSVLTTQVINWAKTSVKECDVARRLVHFAVANQTTPKNLGLGLSSLRDPKLYPLSEQALTDLHARIRDQNYRIFAENEKLYLINSTVHLSGNDPFALIESLLQTDPKNINASHAFYLGYELSKAVTALTLGKQYRQDEPLNWGFLTKDERRTEI